MLISLKELIAKHPKPSSGIFTFDNTRPLKLIITDREGNKVSSYNELQEMPLSQKEIDFADLNWQKIKEKNPSFYDGNVTAIIDVIYDDQKNSLTFMMDKTKYSRTCAMYQQGYPVDSRFEEFASFGLGLMSNLEIGPDGSFLMVERSNKVYSEKGALSVPGGSLEYKESDEKIVDDIKDGLKSAALGELTDEVLGEKSRAHRVKLDSIMWSVNEEGRRGLNAYFGVAPLQPITRSEIYQSFEQAKDKEESTGNFFFVNPLSNIDQSGENNLYATPRDIIEMQKLQTSGTAALATQVYKKTNQSYQDGLLSGLPPHPSGVASFFPNFNIFDVARICGMSIERPLSETPKADVEVDSAGSLMSKEKSSGVKGL